MPATRSAAPTNALNVRIAADFVGRSQRRHRTVPSRTHILGIARENSGPERRRLRLPGLLALGELGSRQIHIHRTLVGVDSDDVAVLEQPDRTALHRLGP